jgi:hypothetical protein
LKGASNGEVVDDVVAEVSTMKLGKVMLISNLWSVETSRYPAWLQGVWQSHSRHADLRKVSSQETPKHPEVLGRAIRRAPHREAFVSA